MRVIDMNEFFNVLEQVSEEGQTITLTGLDGELKGWKSIIHDQELVYENRKAIRREWIQEIRDTNRGNGILVTEIGRVYYEFLQREKRIVICGGGHISMPLIQMGKMMGYVVTVLEDRPKFADDARRAGATEVICEAFEKGLEQVYGDENTYFIIVTRGHRYDQVCLELIMQKRHAYIGMIGSRIRVAKVKETLLENGADRDILNQVYTPIGLKIGAETPEEIAVAIMAQIIEVKNKKKQGCGYSPKLLKAISEADQAGNGEVLATIVTRKGSAPRSTGTKMLIQPDGSCVGTIGGGCVESNVLRRGLHMIRTDMRTPEIYEVDMTGKDAEEDGMVCGGVVEIMLEMV